MASNNSPGDYMFDPNIKIKSEPSDVPTNETSSTNEMPVPLSNIKTEPGDSTSTASSSRGNTVPGTTRLLSFKVPRDLTLGGGIKLEKPKRVYTPNLNVQRSKKEDLPSAEKDGTSKTNKHTKDRDKFNKKKDRPKVNHNLVQSVGIFSEGISSNSSSNRRYGSSSCRESGDKKDNLPLQRSKLNIPEKIDKDAETAKLKELLRDDFIDDGLNLDLSHQPIRLPMCHEDKRVKEKPNKECHMIVDDYCNSSIVGNGNVASLKNTQQSLFDSKSKDVKEPFTTSQVIENKSSSFVLFQLPDCLPGVSSDDATEKKSKSQTDAHVNTSQGSFSTLKNLKEGYFGKLQILKSGNARLVLGDNNLVVDVGSNTSFHQDIVALNINDDKKGGELINLGNVSSTLIFSPDWESLLEKM